MVSTIKQFYKLHIRRIYAVFTIILSTLAVLVVFRASVFFQTIVDPAVGKERESIETQIRKTEAQILEKQTEVQTVRPKYDQLIEAVFPSEITSEKVVTWMNQLVRAAGPDIVLTNVVFRPDRVEKKNDHTVYPVKATFKISRDALTRLTDILAFSGTLTEPRSGILLEEGRVFLPLIQIQKVTLFSDFTTQYDQSGSKLKTSIPIEFELLLYGA